MRHGRAFAIVTGGGTGGHVQPALAVAEALVERGHPRSSLRFVGCHHGMEGRLVPEAGFAITLLPGRGIQRRLTTENIGAAAGLTAACAMAVAEVRRRRPRVVITVGGYAGFPSSLAALAERVPVVVVSYDTVPGAANRLVGRFAAANAVAYPGTPLPRTQVTGPPVRAAVLAVDRSAGGRAKARAALGLDKDRFLVLVTGGSQGARSVNTATIEWCASWRERLDVAAYHVAGERNLDRVKRDASAAGLFGHTAGLDYRLVGYERSMPVLLAACDLVVARAGASTVAELTAVGVPSILVPLPGAPSDHQARNAIALASAGASLTLTDDQCTGERLGTVVETLIGDEPRRREMEAAARRLGHRDAAGRVAELAESVARRA
jgi:UDP-N-acetylglucosamine--N-acetylmuramyl-(pentapeptide) pyrophosphoryl-undecaprenol N-acetylglucosamine transferase